MVSKCPPVQKPIRAYYAHGHQMRGKRFGKNLGGAKEGPEAPHLMALVRALYQNRYPLTP